MSVVVGVRQWCGVKMVWGEDGVAVVLGVGIKKVVVEVVVAVTMVVVECEGGGMEGV